MAGKFMSSRLPAAARYANEDATGSDPQQSEGAALQLQAQEAMEEVLNGSEEIDSLQGDGEELASVYGEVLPEVNSIVDGAQEAGGITTESVALLNILGPYLGVELNTTVATESFGTTGRSQQARRVAMEALSDVMKNWWQKLKAWLKKIWAKLRDWWNRSLSGAASIKSSAEAMKKRASASTNKTIKGDAVSFAGSDELINQNGKVDVGFVKIGMKAFGATSDKVIGEWPRKAAEAAKSYLDAVGNADFGASAEGVASRAQLTTAYAKFTTDLVGSASLIVADIGADKINGPLGINPMFKENLPAGATIRLSPVLPGNRAVYMINSKEGNIDTFKVGFAKLGNKAPEGDIEAKPLGLTDIADVCDSIITLCDNIISAGKAVNDTSKVEADLNKVGDRLEAALAKADDSTKDANVAKRGFTEAAKEINEALSQPAQAFAAGALAASNACLRYAAASLSNAA